MSRSSADSGRFRSDAEITVVTDPGHIRYPNAVSDELAARDTHALLEVPDSDESGELDFRANEGIRLLLRERLLIVSVCLIVVMILTAAINAVDLELMPGSVGLRGVAMFLLLGLMAWIWFAEHISMQNLRRVELLIFSLPVIEMILLQAFRTEMQLTLGKPELIPLIQCTVGLAACLLITMYGIFIPSSWQRTAIVTSGTALLPTGGAWLQMWMNASPSEEFINYNYAIPVFALCMAGVVTLGSHFVASLRKEVEAAKQYGQYQLTEEIGRGGMGVVYRGEHHLLKRPAAIKLIHAESAADEVAIAQFEREVQLSATLTHWNTVRIYDYGRTDLGDFYCVMELLEGLTLSDLLKIRGRLTLQEAVAIIRQICDGLQEAHGKGMVHRDLKPSNVFLATTGGREQVVKILDFGVATTKTESETGETTRMIGTPYYMSPEQIRGRAIDAVSDIYAIGCLLFECLTGDPPFRGSVKEVVEAHLRQAPPLDQLVDDPPGLRSLVGHCLEKDPQQRIQSVALLRTECRRMAGVSEVFLEFHDNQPG